MSAVDTACAGGRPRASVDLRWFRRRQLMVIGGIILAVAVFQAGAVVCDFSLSYALTSVPAALAWMLQNFMPTASSLGELGYVLEQTVSTVLDSVAATVTAAVLSIVLSVLGSRTVGAEWAPARGAIRAFASVVRNVPMVAWALLLLLSFKQNEFTGFLALFLTTFGQLTRFFLDTFDEIPTGPVEALRACGASYWHVVFQAGLPLAAADLMSWMLYMVETNIRSATLIGLLTGTGIGFAFQLYYNSFRYDCAGLVIVLTIVLVLAIEGVSNLARRSMI